MVLKRLKWLKYLFVDRTEAETEQAYWNEKRKAHLANEHSAGIVHGLEVTGTGPPSLRVAVAAGRALGADGNDSEVESAQELDLTGLVPGSGSVTAYVTLAFADVEVEPYFVEETGQFQNKYVQDAFLLEAGTLPPADPAVELARVELAAGATEIADAADPDNPGLNEIDLTQRKRSGWEAPVLAELADVSHDEADAFNNMNSPSASNPVATLADVQPVEAEVVAARASMTSLDGRLDVALGEDGALKGHAATHKGDGLDPVGEVTPTVAGLMSAADKAKLNGVEPGAAAAGEAGDAHAAIVAGNPHGLDPADVGAAPASHVGAGGAEHPVATSSAAGFMSAGDKASLDGHVGAGGPAHALAAAGSTAGFMSGADKADLDLAAASVTWRVLDPSAGNLETQMASISAGDRFWLKPGTYTLGSSIYISQGGVWLVGTREAVINPAADAEIQLMGYGCVLSGFSLRNNSPSVSNHCVHVGGQRCTVEDVWFEGHDTSPGRRTAVLLDAYHCTVRRCKFFVRKTTPACNDPLLRLFSYGTVEDNCFETSSAGDWDATAVLVGAGSAGMVECCVRNNRFSIYIPAARDVTVMAGDGPCGSFAGWIVGNRISVNAAGNYVTGITLGGGLVVDKNWILGCGRYGIHSGGSGDGIQITNNTVLGNGLGYTEYGIRLYNSGGTSLHNAKVQGNYLQYCDYGIYVVFTGTAAVSNTVNINGNVLHQIAYTAIHVSGDSTYFMERINVNENNIDGFSSGIVFVNCRRGTCGHNQLVGGTGIGIDLGSGVSYDVKVACCDVETAGAYCYRVGHQRNVLLGCSGRGASTAIYYVTGSHNHVVSCETHGIFNADVLRVEGDSHNIHDNDFSYSVSAGYYSVNLTGTAGGVFVHGNRLYQPGNFGTNNMIYDNVVNDAYTASGF